MSVFAVTNAAEQLGDMSWDAIVGLVSQTMPPAGSGISVRLTPHEAR
jgi:hypothetical protein